MTTTLPIVSSIREGAEELRHRFSSAAPFPHLVLDELLEPDLLRRLYDEFPSFDEQRAANELGHIRGKAVQEQISAISPAYRELHQVIQTPEFLQAISEITGIDDLLFDPEYFGGGTHENLTGQELHYHVDFNYHPIRKWHRRLNLIIFLNHEWRREWGGNLQLHRDAWRNPGRRGAPRVRTRNHLRDIGAVMARFRADHRGADGRDALPPIHRALLLQ